MKIGRDNVLRKFISEANIHNYIMEKIPQDASARCYYRILYSNKTAILMHCPLEYTSLKPFIDINIFLDSLGVTVPKIYRYDIELGLMLLEDFGDISMNNFVNADNEVTEYKNIIDLLLHIQNSPVPSFLPLYTKDLLLKELSVYCYWYCKYATGIAMDSHEADDLISTWSSILESTTFENNVFVMRDFHVDNLMRLNTNNKSSAQNHDWNNIGVLDFQDGIIGPRVYDLVSLLNDARRNVRQETAIHLIKYYVNKTDSNHDKIIEQYNILGAQRNMRILGIFARKLLKDNNDSYLKFIPRVLSYLEENIKHPSLFRLKRFVKG